MFLLPVLPVLNRRPVPGIRRDFSTLTTPFFLEEARPTAKSRAGLSSVMQGQNIDVAVRSEDDLAEVDVSGEVDLYTAPILWGHVSTVVSGGTRRLVLDLGG